MSQLHDDIIIHIVRHDIKLLCILSLVCMRWYKALKNKRKDLKFVDNINSISIPKYDGFTSKIMCHSCYYTLTRAKYSYLGLCVAIDRGNIVRYSNLDVAYVKYRKVQDTLKERNNDNYPFALQKNIHYYECTGAELHFDFSAIIVQEAFVSHHEKHGPYKYWVFKLDKSPMFDDFRLTLIESYSALCINDEIIAKLQCPPFAGSIKCICDD